MEYEICKRLKDGDTFVWSAIAWSDVRVYAEDILYALNLAYDDKYAILCDGQPYRSPAERTRS